jgi:ribosome maturation protein Sdo1
LYEDNTSTIEIVKKKRIDGRTKHVEIKTHYISDMIKEGKIDIQYLKSENQLADTLTKPLGKIKFQKFRKGLGVVDLSENHHYGRVLN